MFCRKCGSMIPDDSAFCNVCGFKQVMAEQVQMPKETETFSKTYGLEPTVPEVVKPEPVGKKPSTEKVSFDWSNVKDEPRKKVIEDIASPWDVEEPAYEEPVIDEAPSQEPSRTLSFIEILKQEKADKLKAAEADAYDLTAKEETFADYTPFEEAPSFYVPPLYNDITRASEAPLEEPAFEEPKYEAPVFETPKYEASLFEELVYGAHEQEEPASEEPVFEEPKQEAPIFEEPVFVEPEQEEPVYEVPVATYNAEDDLAANDPDKLSAELDAILEAAMGIPQVDAEESPEDIYLSMDEPEATETVSEPRAARAADSDDEEVISLEELVAEAPFEKDDLMEKRATIAAVVEEESEIDALKRKLAELMGEPAEPEELPKKEELAVDELFAEEEPEADDSIEDDFLAEFAAEEPEVAVEEAPVVEEPVAEAEAPVVEDLFVESAPVIEEAVAEPEAAAEPAPKAESDALSIEELEKDLFGEVTTEEIEAEATKKIDKFYTLYRKNEEFQRLLDEEYNKLKAEEEAIGKEPAPAAAEPVKAVEEAASAVEAVAPAVEAVAPAAQAVAEPVAEAVAEPAAAVAATEAVALAENIPQADAKAAKADQKAAAKAEKAAAKAAAKAAKKAKKSELIEDEEIEQGSGVLTVIAVIIAILLVILLAVILVLNFAPDSAIAMKLNAVIENIASYFTVVDNVKKGFLL
ncbi:MAG: hypothetical protein KBS63_02470 [Clostridiales bacterium]|nr:hypothetical protein [Candidatus Crickella caballi]